MTTPNGGTSPPPQRQPNAFLPPQHPGGPVAPQPVYLVPAGPPRPRNGCGDAALVFGILAIVLGPLWALVAIPCGAVGVDNANKGVATNKPSAQWGMWLGVASIILWTIFLIVIFATG